MKIVSNELKIALKQPTTQRKGRILVNGNYYEVYNVEYYADAYNEGNVIGNAIASQLDFDLPYMDKFETFKYYDGVWTGVEYEYVDMGTFTVFDERDEDEFNKHITAFDNLIKFNKQFEDVGGYPKTLYQELENICSQAEVELQNASIPNGNFSVENNQFVEGENLKTVLKAIEQISGTYGIIKNDKLVLQLKNQTSEKINKNDHEPITWKRRTYGINQLILGMEDVQGEYVLRQDDEDIAINGVHKLVINDNPFVYTQQKREQVIDELFNQVKGFGYVPYDLKMEWLNYMDIGDTISIDGIETLILRMYGKSPKSLESEMSAPAIIDSAVEYSNNTFSLTKRVSRTEFGVDKNAKEIQGIIETTETIQKEINPTKDESGSEIIIEDASNNSLTYLEIEGKSTQVTTSGKNLLPKDNISNKYVSVNENGTYNIIAGTPTSTIYATGKGFSLPAGTYTFSSTELMQDSVQIYLWNETDNNYDIQLNYYTDKLTFTLTDTKTMHIMFLLLPDRTVVNQTFGLQIELGEVKTDWEEYGKMPSPQTPSEIKSVGTYNEETGKYGIEVEIVGKNLFDGIYEKGYINVSTGVNTGSAHMRTKNYVSVLGNTTYTFSGEVSAVRYGLYYDEQGNYIGYIMITDNSNIGTFTTLENVRYLRWYVINQQNLNEKTQLEKSSVGTDYVPYEKKLLSMALNAPLRSLPNGVRDIAYIRNNKLYVDRYVGSVVLNGSEDWIISGTLTNTIRYAISSSYLPDCSQYNYTNHTMSNYLVYLADYEADTPHYYIEGVGTSNFFFIPKTTASTLAEFKTWLSTHNTQVDYELATPITEELGEINMPSTLKGVNHITTTDELQPIINLTYVRDTVIADYVENHVTELKLTESEIKASVESVSSSVDGLNTTINRVEEITNDNSQVINVISTNIDRTSGEVREVTTTTGFTFNADGMTIDDGSGFKAEHTADGTYYKDGSSIVGQYTKDGSKQKDLQLFGIYSYGMRDKDDTPMFVGQLYTDANGEECFGHFYNGEG